MIKRFFVSFFAIGFVFLSFAQGLDGAVGDVYVKDDNGNVLMRMHVSDYKKFDTKGHLVYVKQDNGTEYIYTYDSADHLIYSKDSSGEQWWTYDSAGREIYHKEPWWVGWKEFWNEYDANGNETLVKQLINGELWESRSEYDSNGILRKKTTSEGKSWEYDENGKLLYEHWWDIGGTFENWYKYDSNGNEIYFKNSRGTEIWSEYNAAGKLKYQKTATKGKVENEEWREYNSAGIEISRKDTAGTVYEFDSVGHLIHKKQKNGYEEWQKYDSNGTLISKKDTNGMLYEYDSKGNLLHENAYGNETWYEYDSAGNKISEKHANGKETQWYSNGNMKYEKNSSSRSSSCYEAWYKEDGTPIHKLSQADGKVVEEYKYDSNGNEVYGKCRNYDNTVERTSEYNANGKLIHKKATWIPDSPTEPPSAEEEWHEYDTDGNETYYKRYSKSKVIAISDIGESIGTREYTEEIWQEFDPNGNVVYKRTKEVSQEQMPGKSPEKRNYESEKFYEYTFYPNGKPATCSSYSIY